MSHPYGYEPTLEEQKDSAQNVINILMNADLAFITSLNQTWVQPRQNATLEDAINLAEYAQ